MWFSYLVKLSYDDQVALTDQVGCLLYGAALKTMARRVLIMAVPTQPIYVTRNQRSQTLAYTLLLHCSYDDQFDRVTPFILGHWSQQPWTAEPGGLISSCTATRM